MFEGLYMEMRFHANEAVVMQLSDGVMVRSGLTQRQERNMCCGLGRQCCVHSMRLTQVHSFFPCN